MATGRSSCDDNDLLASIINKIKIYKIIHKQRPFCTLSHFGKSLSEDLRVRVHKYLGITSCLVSRRAQSD